MPTLREIAERGDQVEALAYLKRIRARDLARYHRKKLEPEFRARTNEIRWKSRGIINSEGKPFSRLDYDRAYQVQQGRCKICGKHASESRFAIAVDHDHKTGKFRALLCQGCNVVVGVYEKHGESARRYLECL